VVFILTNVLEKLTS